MSKAAENLQRRFGQNLSESLGARTSPPARPDEQFHGEIGRPEAAPDDGRTRAREAGHMELARIIPDPEQPRKEFSEESLDRLAASLLRHGQLMPIRVRWKPELGKWVVISGERRYRAAHKARLKTVACIFTDALTPAEVLQEQLVENLLREDLRPIEQAHAYRQLMDLHGWTAKALATELHISQATISRTLALLELPQDLQARVEAGTLPASAAYEIARVGDETSRRALADEIATGGLTRDEAAARRRNARGRKGRGARPLVRTIKTSVGKVTIALSRKAVGDEALLSALEEAVAQVRAARAKRTDGQAAA